MPVCLLDARRSSPGDAEGQTVVPLFIERAMELVSSGGRPLFLDELIPTETFHALNDRALRCRDRFLAEVRGGESLGEPEALAFFQGDELQYFFREILFAQAVAEVLLDADFERIDFRSGIPGAGSPAAGEGFYRALVAAFEAAGEGSRLRRLAGGTVVGGVSRGLGVRMGNAYRKLRNRLESFYSRGPVPGRCVAIFSSSQWHRFRDALEDLRAHYGTNLVFWYLGRCDAAIRRWAAEGGVALSQIPLPSRLDAEVVRCFERRHRGWLAHGRHQLADEMACPALAAPALEGDFELLLHSTLPRAAQWSRKVSRHLAAVEPELVVGSAAFTHAGAMPLLVAEHLGIPSLALSHTYFSGDHGPVPSRWLACRSGFERRGYRRVVEDDRRIIFCRNASDALSYEVEATTSPPASKERKRVALLAASPQVDGQVMPLHELGPWVRTLLALARPTAEIDGVEWVFKFHPRFDVSSHLEEHGLAEGVRIVPATASVHELLAESWLAVLVEHMGGVGIDARLAGVPLIFLDSAHYRFARVDAESLEAERVDSTEDLWRLVGELAADPERYHQLQEKNRRYVERWLRPAGHTLAEALELGLAEAAGIVPMGPP